MRKLILMTSAAIIVPLSSWGEDITCTLTKDCTDLGYTSTTSCDNGVKCPWGEAWFCPPEKSEICEIGSILYSDMTCYKEAQTGKTPIGVVVYVDGLGGGQALALNSVNNGTSYQWGGYGANVSSLPDYTAKEAASTDYASCENSKIIMAAGDKYTYPAAWAANEYSTEGTKAGDWCLPAAGIFTSYYNNQEAVNTGFSRANGTPFYNYTYAWSSSEYNRNYVWDSYFSYRYGLDYLGKYGSYEVRPVFEFVQTFEGMCKASQQYACTGENETGGVGDACAGKYSECSCAEGYIWKNGSCVEFTAEFGQCNGYAANCAIGDILFSDGTCSTDVVDGKTPIAIVVYKSDDGNCGQALALNSVNNGTSYQWGGYGANVSSLPDYTTEATAAADYTSCENSKIIMTVGNSSTYRAVWAANEYSTEGTSAGDWCLPAAGIFTSYYNSQEAINTGFSRANGIQFTTSTKAWSSSESISNGAWYSYFSTSYGLDRSGKGNFSEVRPVIEF